MEKKRLEEVLPGSVSRLMDRIDSLSSDQRKQLREELQRLLSTAERRNGKIVVRADGSDAELDVSEVSDVFEAVGADDSKIEGETAEKARHFVDDSRLYAVLSGRLGKEETARFIEDIKIRSQRKATEYGDRIDKMVDLESLITEMKTIEESGEKYELGDINTEIAALNAKAPLTSKEAEKKTRLESKRDEMVARGVVSEPRPTSDDLKTKFERILEHPEDFGLTKEEGKRLKDDKGNPKIDEIKRALERAKQLKAKLEEEKKLEETKHKLLEDKARGLEKVAELSDREAEKAQEARDAADRKFARDWDASRIDDGQIRRKYRELHEDDRGIFKRIGNAIRARFLTKNARREALNEIKRIERNSARGDAEDLAVERATTRREKNERKNVQKVVSKVIETGEYKRGSESRKVFHEHDDDEGR